MSQSDQYLRYFRKSEFDCNCGTAFCTRNKMQFGFMKRLDIARQHAGIPFHVTSGFRCKDKQAALVKSGASSKKKSSHEKGICADIFVKSDKARSKILNGIIKAGFTRIGIGKNWVHVDTDKDKNMNRVWIYKW